MKLTCPASQRYSRLWTSIYRNKRGVAHATPELLTAMTALNSVSTQVDAARKKERPLHLRQKRRSELSQ